MDKHSEFLPTIDLNQALSSFEAPEEIKKALAHALTNIQDDEIATASEADLAAVDAVAKSRVVYVVSLLKLLSFLTRVPKTWAGAESQATAALGYIKHAEQRNLSFMQMKRTASDAALAQEIKKLKDDLMKLATIKAQKNAAKEIPSRPDEAPTSAEASGT